MRNGRAYANMFMENWAKMDRTVGEILSKILDIINQTHI